MVRKHSLPADRSERAFYHLHQLGTCGIFSGLSLPGTNIVSPSFAISRFTTCSCGLSGALRGKFKMRVLRQTEAAI